MMAVMWGLGLRSPTFAQSPPVPAAPAVPASVPASAAVPVPPTLSFPDERVQAQAAIKADFLLKFLDYVEIPGVHILPPDSPLVVAVSGADEVYLALQKSLRHRHVRKHPVISRRLTETDPLHQVHVLYLGPRVELAQSLLFRTARTLPLLLVTDSQQALDNLGVINFMDVDGRVRFEVSLDAADRVGIKVSSLMLSVAERVVGGR